MKCSTVCAAPLGRAEASDFGVRGPSIAVPEEMRRRAAQRSNNDNNRGEQQNIAAHLTNTRKLCWCLLD